MSKPSTIKRGKTTRTPTRTKRIPKAKKPSILSRAIDMIPISARTRQRIATVGTFS